MKLFNKIKNSEFFKMYKEELIFVPLLLIAFYLLNALFINLFPASAFFDFYSEIETIISKIVVFTISLWVAHLALSVSFPKIYKFLHKMVMNFDDIPQEKKIEYTIKFILTFILAAALVFSSVGATKTTRIDYRSELVCRLDSQLFVREIKPNRSPMIDKYLITVNSSVGNPWCAAFVGANLTWLGIENPNSAWSPAYTKPKDVIWKQKGNNNLKPESGDVVSFYYSNLGRVGHVGFFIEDKDGYYITIEGNTNGVGSRDGDGVYKKKRDPKKIYTISRYIKTN